MTSRAGLHVPKAFTSNSPRAITSCGRYPAVDRGDHARRRPRHLKENPCVDARDILDFSLIHILGYDDDWRYWFQTYDLDPHQVPRGLSAIDAALRGDGIFSGRRPFIDTYLKSGQLAEVFQKPQTLNATYYLRQNKTGNKTRNADRVALWLHDLTKGTD
ncbi:MAG: hypothetical protein L3J30_12425 [Marinosulfonomonas sp.]|nr:hypothetical protein [Marinosulfonomonas sp.]